MSLAQTTDEVAILETREASPTHFLVKIESFLLGGIRKYETQEFDAGGYKWRLIVYPNEDKTGTEKDYLSVNLAISGTSLPPSWEVTAVFSFFLFNQISCNYLYSLGRTRRFLPMKPEWGISKFMSKKVLTDPLSGYLIDNNCVFGAEVFIVEKCAMITCLSQKVEKCAMITRLSQNVVKCDWKISNFSKLGEVWRSERFVAGGFNWDVSLYPKGKDDAEGQFLSVYLRLIDSEKVKTSFSICIKDQINNEHNKKTTTNCFSDGDWGWNKFVLLSTLEDPKNGLIIGDCCHLEIEMSFDPIV